MQADDVDLLFEYDAWATERLLAQTDGLDPARLSAPPAPGHAPIGPTLLHIFDATRLWRTRCQGLPRPPRFTEADAPTPAALRALCEREGEEMRAFLAQRGGDDDAVVRWAWGDAGELPGMRRRYALLQAITHAVAHRAEVAQSLTLLGHSPGNLDLFFFLMERGLVDGA